MHKRTNDGDCGYEGGSHSINLELNELSSTIIEREICRARGFFNRAYGETACVQVQQKKIYDFKNLDYDCLGKRKMIRNFEMLLDRYTRRFIYLSHSRFGLMLRCSDGSGALASS